MYAKIDGSTVVKYPYTMKALQNDNPNVSFPAELNAELKLEYNVADVHENARPEFDPLTQDVVEAPMTVIEGVAQINYIVKEASETQKISRITEQRKKFLEDTDYFGLSDVTMSEEWRVYRQALRDIPQQSSFPDNVTWPTPPGSGF